MTTLPTQRQRVETLIDLGREREALTAAGVLIAEHGEDGEAWCLVGRAQLGLGEHHSALEAANKAVGLGAEDPGWAHRIRSIALSRLDRGSEAIAAAQEALAAAPYEWQSHHVYAVALLEHPMARAGSDATRPWQANAVVRESLRQAGDAAARAVELDPNEPSTLLVLAQVRDLQNRKQEALELADRAVALAPADAGVLRRRTAILDDERRLTAPAIGFATAAALDPAGRGAEDFGGIVRRAAGWGLWLAIPVMAVLMLIMHAADPSPSLSGRFVHAAAVGAGTLAALVTPMVRLLLGIAAVQRRPALRALRRHRGMCVAMVAFAAGPVLLVLTASDATAGLARLQLSFMPGLLIAAAIGRFAQRSND